MALVVFISTTGFAIYEHHCNCTDTVETKLFVEESNCCDHEPAGCCDSGTQSCGLEGEAQGHDCCTSSMNYVKINIPVDLPVQKKSHMHNSKLLVVHETTVDDIHHEDDLSFNREGYTYVHSCKGPDLLIRYHQLKIAPPTA